MIKLFYAADTCSLASHIALEDAAADYSTARIDFATNQQRSAEYLAVNPKGRVPALETNRHLDRDAGHAGLHRAAFSARAAGAAG
jgi:glutathione S-transferase